MGSSLQASILGSRRAGKLATGSQMECWQKDDIVNLQCSPAELDLFQRQSPQSLAYAGFLLSRKILHDIHGIYIDFAQSPVHLHHLLQAWNLFAHISHLIDHSQSSRILRAGVHFTSICQANFEEMLPLDATELYDILLTGYCLATQEERAEVVNNTPLDWDNWVA
jgi:hypothetical protein